MDRSTVNIDLYKTLYLIRRSEERIRDHYMEDEMKTPVHLSVGEEAIAAGVVHALRPTDPIFGTYRSHGIYLARTGETDKFFAELYGKQTGVAKGKAGSMHLFSPPHHFMGASAVVTTIIPVAVGAAFAHHYQQTDNIVAVFFGDGALDEGGFWESLNFACLRQLPILFVCEDNGLAIHSTKEERQGYDSIVDIVKQFRCTVVSDTTTDVEQIYKKTTSALRTMRKTPQPCFLYLKYYRYLEHVGINEDFQFGYRSKDEFEKWQKIDPVDLQRKKLVTLGISPQEIQTIEEAIDNQIQQSIEQAKTAPFPEHTEICQDVFA